MSEVRPNSPCNTDLTPFAYSRGHGSPKGIRAPDSGGARHPLRPPVVHRCPRLPEIGGHRAGRTRGCLRRGHRLRWQRDRGVLACFGSGHRRETRPVDVPDPAVGHEQGPPALRAHVLRYRDARRLAVLGRLAPRSASPAEQGSRPRFQLLRPSGDRVLPAQGQPRGRHTADAGRQRWLLRPGRPRLGAQLPPSRDRRTRVDGHLRGIQSPRDCARTTGDRSSVRRRLVDGGQHHDFPLRGQGSRDRGGCAGNVHAQTLQRPGGVGDAHPYEPVRGRHQRLPQPGRPDATVGDRQIVHRRHSRARQRDQCRDQPVGQLLQAARSRRRGTHGCVLGPGQPLCPDPRTDVHPEQGLLAARGNPQS